jgi:hypothetical protein
VVAAVGPKFYPVVKPGPDPKQTRKLSSAGKATAHKRTGKLSTLENWEGYRVFRDARSPTGWINLHRVPIDAVDTNGHPLRRNLHTGKLLYVDANPPSGGLSVLGYVSKALQFSPFAPDVLGLGLDAAGLSGVNEARAGAAVAATGAIVGAGGLGATSLAGLTGASSTAGGLSTLLGGGAGGFASLLGSPVAASGLIPIPPASTRPASSSSAGPGPILLVAGALVVLLLLRK